MNDTGGCNSTATSPVAATNPAAAQAATADPAAAPATQPVSPVAKHPVQEFELDGVRCFWAPGDGPLTAGLIFGVGMSDEDFEHRGITHLIEHLSLHDIDKGLSYNGAVDLTTTMLHCTGRLEDVRSYFQSALHALNEFPFHELERESRVLAAESARTPHSYAIEAMSIFYGFRGPGALALGESGLRAMTPEKVNAWKQRFFVKGNAAAFFSGPRPEGVSFAALADGPRAPRNDRHRILQPGQHFYHTQCAGPTVFSELERGIATTVVTGIAERRLTEHLRGELGISYNVSVSLNELDASTNWFGLVADAANTEDASKIFTTMRGELDRLATEGPTKEEVIFSVAQMDKAFSGEFGDPRPAEALGQARYFVEGRPYIAYAEARAQLAATPLSAYGTPLANALRSPLWVLPFGTPVADARIESVPMWSQTASDPGAKTYTSKYNDNSLRIDDTKLSLVTHEGHPLTVTLGEVEGLLRYSDGGCTFYTAEGYVIRLIPADYNADSAVAEFVSKIPASLIVSIGEPLRSEEVAAQLEPKKAPGLRDRIKGKGFGKKSEKGEKRRFAKSTPEQKLAVPPFHETLGHLGATQMAEAMIASDWVRVEEIYRTATDDNERQHMLSVAMLTGGRPDRLDPWVNGSAAPGLALLVRGKMGVQWAWDARSSARSEHVSAEMFEEFFSRLRTAETDLLLAVDELPESPLPWVSLITTAKGLQIPRAEAENRYINHVERGPLLAGHLTFQQYVCRKWFGSHDDMWEHAEFVCSTSPDGSASLSIGAMAFVEHWLDISAAGDSIYEEANMFVDAIGRREFVMETMKRSHGSSNFPVSEPDGAAALSTFFTAYLVLREHQLAVSLMNPIGERFQEFPARYFSSVSWNELRASVRDIAAHEQQTGQPVFS